MERRTEESLNCQASGILVPLEKLGNLQIIKALASLNTEHAALSDVPWTIACPEARSPRQNSS
jgi:hypothetical protein